MIAANASIDVARLFPRLPPRPSPSATTADMAIVRTADDLVAMLRVRLGRLAPSPERRRLEAELWTYRKTLNRWRTVAPHDEQARALIDLLLELEARTQRRATASPDAVARHELPNAPLRAAAGAFGWLARAPGPGPGPAPTAVSPRPAHSGSRRVSRSSRYTPK